MRPEAYYEFLRGTHLEGRGQVDEAITAFERAASLDPHAADIPAELAALYARQGNLPGARESAEAALKIDPDNVDAHRVLGGILASMVESEGEAAKSAAPDTARLAIDHLEHGRRPDGTDQDTGLDIALARLYLRLGDNQKAVEVLHRVTEYEPDAGEAYVLLARAESALGHPDRAIAAVEQAADGNPRMLPTLAQLYEDQKQWSNAARTYERLSEVNPTSLDVKTRWAAALLQDDGNDGAATKAKELLTEVTAGAPTEPRPLYLLSMAERKRRDFAAAEAAARASDRRLTPRAPPVRSRWRRCTRISGSLARRRTCSRRPSLDSTTKTRKAAATCWRFWRTSGSRSFRPGWALRPSRRSSVRAA